MLATCLSGDLNNDGADDLLVGAQRNSDAGVWTGKVYLYLGGAALDSVADLTAAGEVQGDGFGAAVRICDDFDGDGCMGRFNFYPAGTQQFAAGGWNIGGTGAARLYGEAFTSTGTRPPTPAAVAVHAYPNPFSSRLHVDAELPVRGRLEVVIYDVRGRRVAELFRGESGPGAVSLQWPRAGARIGLPAGVYFLQLRHRGTTTQRKIILTR